MSDVILNVNPTDLGFGDVAVGEQAEIDIQFTITGGPGDVVNVSNISTPAGYTLSISNFQVTYYQPYTVKVYFNPTAVTDYDGSGEVDSDAYNPAVPLTFSGSGVAFSLSPSSLDFGVSPLTKATAQQLVTITNLQATSIVVTAITIPSQFIAGSTFPTLPYTIAGSGNVQFGVAYKPTLPGQITSNVTVTVTGAGSLGVKVTGSAYPPFVVGYQLPYFAATSGNVAAQALPLEDVELESGVSNGGLSGGISLLVMPVQNLNDSGSPFELAYHDATDLASNINQFNVTFPAEDTPEYRPVTVKKIVIIAANSGDSIINYTLTGSLRGISSSVSGTMVINAVSGLPATTLIQSETDVVFTASLLQLQLYGSVNASAYNIAKVKLICTAADDNLI